MPRASFKYYTSAQLLQLARDGVRASAADSLQAISAIVFSALALEALVNELLDRVREPFASDAQGKVRHLAAVAEAAGLYEKTASIAAKVQVMAAVLRGEVLATDRQPYQDFDLLIQVRNFVVHTRPELMEQDETGAWKAKKILHGLAARKVIDPPSTTVANMVMNHLQDRRVAEWAYQTMVETIAELVDCFPRQFRAAESLQQTYGRENLSL